MNLPLKLAIVKNFRTQWQFAKQMGVQESYVSDVIHGKRSPSLSRQEKWAAALNEDAEALFGGGETDVLA